MVTAIRPVDQDIDMVNLVTPKPVRRSLSRVSFSKDTLHVQPPPNPEGRTLVGKYITREATMRVWREKLHYGASMQDTAHTFGRVGMWARKGGEVDGFSWMTCSWCLGSCMIEQQRQAMEVKLHRWHKERGDQVGEEPNMYGHIGSGGLCSCRHWPCNRSWLVAENVGALANFKAVQGQMGWPANQPWGTPDDQRRELGRVPMVEEMEREPWGGGGPTNAADDANQEADPLVMNAERRLDSRDSSPACDRLCNGDHSASAVGSPAHLRAC